MRLVVLSVGKIKEPALRQAIDEYWARVRRHYAIEEIELRAAPAEKLTSAFEQRIPQGAHVVALDSTGTERTSEDFALWLGRRFAQGKGAVAFLLGGADGLPSELVARAKETLSLSMMTFPHRLARLVLAEQLYRATTILHHEPYAKL
jgi:23S rRNA (pseudouridine1915-N3)-methyltransferase